MAAAPKNIPEQASPAAPVKPRFNPWVVAAVVSLAAFMEVLDTSIANVALPYMAGGLGASVDNASWVLTSYLVATAVVLPISGWLSIRCGRKRYYMASVVVFTISYFLRGIAASLGMLILFRVLQGAAGGGLEAVAQAILKDTFPPEQLGTAFAMYGMVAVLGPGIGSTVGSVMTDTASWRWICYMNVAVGIISLLLLYRILEDPAYLTEQVKKLRGHLSLDYIGIGVLALALGSLQVVLDKGQEDNWFHSHLIATLAVIFPIALAVFLVWELTRKKPVLDLRMFKNRNFAGAAAMMFVLGIEIYSVTFLIPQFVQALLGYTLELSGMTQMPSSVLMLGLFPPVGVLVRKIEARWLIAAGFLLSAIALFHLSNLDLQIDFRTAVMYKFCQSFRLALLFIPINPPSYIVIPQAKGA